jgi:hypothetical protein
VGLTAYYPLDEDSGPVLDYAGSNDGTVYGATQGVTGIAGTSAYSFDGVDDTVQIDANLFPAETPVSVCAWTRLDAAATPASADYEVFTRGDAPKLWFYNGNVAGYYGDGSGSTYKLAGPTAQTDRWYHLVLCLEANGATLYVDGTQVDTAPGESGVNSGWSTNTAYLGRDDDGSRFLFGTVDDVRVYDHALSAPEVSYLYEAVTEPSYTFTETLASASTPALSVDCALNGQSATATVRGSPGTPSEESQTVTLADGANEYPIPWDSSHIEFQTTIDGTVSDVTQRIEVTDATVTDSGGGSTVSTYTAAPVATTLSALTPLMWPELASVEAALSAGDHIAVHDAGPGTLRTVDAAALDGDHIGEPASADASEGASVGDSPVLQGDSASQATTDGGVTDSPPRSGPALSGLATGALLVGSDPLASETPTSELSAGEIGESPATAGTFMTASVEGSASRVQPTYTQEPLSVVLVNGVGGPEQVLTAALQPATVDTAFLRTVFSGAGLAGGGVALTSGTQTHETYSLDAPTPALASPTKLLNSYTEGPATATTADEPVVTDETYTGETVAAEGVDATAIRPTYAQGLTTASLADASHLTETYTAVMPSGSITAAVIPETRYTLGSATTSLVDGMFSLPGYEMAAVAAALDAGPSDRVTVRGGAGPITTLSALASPTDETYDGVTVAVTLLDARWAGALSYLVRLTSTEGSLTTTADGSFETVERN